MPFPHTPFSRTHFRSCQVNARLLSTREPLFPNLCHACFACLCKSLIAIKAFNETFCQQMI